MYCRLALATLALFIGYECVSAQQIPSTTTAAELWNPWTWFWPYAKASAEGYRDFYDKAQKATNELYQQIYKTNAFPWITGNWGLPPQDILPGGNGDERPGQDNQGGKGERPGQDNQGGKGEQPGQDNQGGKGEQSGQDSQGGNNGEQSGQDNQGGNGGGQPGQEGTTPSNQDSDQENGTTEGAGSQSNDESGKGVEVQGNIQNDGTGGANANVDGEEIQA